MGAPGSSVELVIVGFIVVDIETKIRGNNDCE